MFEGIDDTIVAISTPPGRGQRGMVRLSGPEVFKIAARMFIADDGSALDQVEFNTRLSGCLVLYAEQFLLPAEAFIFRAPHSYTREEVIEFHTTAAPPVLAGLVDRAQELGASLAKPGEFAARAFYHGALDLAEVEGIAALIRARSDQQLRAANAWRDGHLAHEIRSVRKELIDLVSLVEADIDFTEEPIDFIQPAELKQKVDHLAHQLELLLNLSDSIAHMSYLPRVMIVGHPNTGKSTLMNRLSGMNRAICSPIGGTTRDYLSAVVRLHAGEVEVVDTAGMGKNLGKMEKISKFFFDRELGKIDLVCHLLDLAHTPLEEQILPEVISRPSSIIWVANKSDLVESRARQEAVERLSLKVDAPVYTISAATGDGVEQLRKAISVAIFDIANNLDSQWLMVSSAHREAVVQAAEALQRAAGWCDQNRDMINCAEWVAADLRSALGQLGILFGEITTDDLLDRIFSGFCIGK